MIYARLDDWKRGGGDRLDLGWIAGSPPAHTAARYAAILLATGAAFAR